MLSPCGSAGTARSCLPERTSAWAAPSDGSLHSSSRSLQNAEGLPPHLRRGNLSLLKKKWESPAPAAEPRGEHLRSAGTELRHRLGGSGLAAGSSSSASCEQPPGAGEAPKAQVCPASTSGQPQAPAADSRTLRSRSPDGGKMENCLRGAREVEKAEGSESSEPSGRIERYNVPLSKLKMMFEKGEAAQSKVRIQPQGSQSSAASGRVPGGSGSSAGLCEASQALFGAAHSDSSQLCQRLQRARRWGCLSRRWVWVGKEL